MSFALNLAHDCIVKITLTMPRHSLCEVTCIYLLLES